MENSTAPNKDAFVAKAQGLAQRARAHGIDMKPGAPFLDILELCLNRLDLYRDLPSAKGRLLVE